MRPFFAVLERAQNKGDWHPRHRVPDVVAAIVGPLFYRRWFSKESIDSQFVKGVVRSIVERTSPK
jgi:tetracycline repressor-like protein